MPGDSPPWPHLRHHHDESAVQGSPGLAREGAVIGDLLSSAYRIARSLTSATGRSVVWTRLRHPRALHQTATTTAPDRYPELFSGLARHLPRDAEILSFGCSTGEELLSLRALLPAARLTGVEINPHARRIATQRTANDPLTRIVSHLPDGQYDAVLALAVLQREPHRVIDERITDLAALYPFARFDAALSALAERLRPRGFFAIVHAHYRVEDSTAAPLLNPVVDSPAQSGPLFDRNSRRYDPTPPAATLFVRCTATASASSRT